MAIAFDAKSNTSATCSVSSKTVSHTCSGTDRILFAIVTNHTAHGTISGVTYAGVAMTKVAEYNDGGTRVGLWYLINPATGANNITATCTASTGCIGVGGLSFTGVDQITPIDAFTSGTVAATTSFTQTVTSIADNCFAVWAIKAANGSTLTGGSNTTIGSQPEVVAHGTSSAYSTAAKTPAGSFSLNVTSATQVFTGVLASFKPAAGGGGPTFVPKATWFM